MVVRHDPLLAQHNGIISELLIKDLPVLLEGLFHSYFPVTFFPSVDEGTFDGVSGFGEYFWIHRDRKIQKSLSICSIWPFTIDIRSNETEYAPVSSGDAEFVRHNSSPMSHSGPCI